LASTIQADQIPRALTVIKAPRDARAIKTAGAIGAIVIDTTLSDINAASL